MSSRANDSIEKVKFYSQRCQISKRGYQQGRVMKQWKKHDINLRCQVRSSYYVVVGLFE